MQVVSSEKTVKITLEMTEEEQKQIDNVFNELYTKHVNDPQWAPIWALKDALTLGIQ